MGPVVRTRGSAVVPARPDRAEVHLDLRHLASTPDAALDQVAERSRQLEALLDALGITRQHWSTSGLSVSELREWDGNRQRSRGYQATSQTVVRLTEADVIGRLLSAAVNDVGASVRGPHWLVDPDNVANLEAYRMAAEDARRRAATYAGALGLRLGAVEELAEPGAGPVDHGFNVVHAARMAGGPEDEIALNPGRVDVSAAIDATFALVPVEEAQGQPP